MRWIATYEDGSRLVENEASLCAYQQGQHEGSHGIACLNQLSRVVSLALEDEREREVARVLIPEGTTPDLFRRYFFVVSGSGSLPSPSVAHVIGWKRDDVRTLLAIMPDGRTLLTSDPEDLR